MKAERWKAEFTEFLELRNGSPRTVEAYASEVAPFLEFLARQGVQSLG